MTTRRWRRTAVTAALLGLLLLLPGSIAHPHWPPWATDMGGATPSGASLEMSGTLKPDEVLWLQCWQVPPSSPAVVLAGTVLAAVPFEGGKIIPNAQLSLPAMTTSYGTLGQAMNLPAILPNSGIIYVQVWAESGSGWIASNGVKIDLSKGP